MSSILKGGYTDYESVINNADLWKTETINEEQVVDEPTATIDYLNLLYDFTSYRLILFIIFILSILVIIIYYRNNIVDYIYNKVYYKKKDDESK